VAKRPRFSRWRRLPPVFRSGEHRPVGTGNEVDRIILYLPSRLLDLAEKLAEKAGIPAIQDYCAGLLARAIESEQVRQKVADFEAKRGPLKGLKEIADDPDYLAEWQAQAETKPAPPPIGGIASSLPPGDPPRPDLIETISIDLALADGDHPVPEPSPEGEAWDAQEAAPALEPPSFGGEPAVESPSSNAESSPGPVPQTIVRIPGDRAALEVLWRHVAMGQDDWAFLPCLRRGVPVPDPKASELILALHQLELEHRGAEVLDRRVAHALHRLALESQVLLTDAWPGVFDDPTIGTIRTVQEAVERILSGEDIRYYPRPAQNPSEPTL
jgi:hypothetical protein